LNKSIENGKNKDKMLELGDYFYEKE